MHNTKRTWCTKSQIHNDRNGVPYKNSSQVKCYIHLNLFILNFSNIITIPIKHQKNFKQRLHLSRDDLQIRKMITVMDRHTSDTCGLAKSQISLLTVK